MSKKTQTIFTLDQKSNESKNWLVENGYNVSALVREFLNQKVERAKAFIEYENQLEEKNRVAEN